MSKSVKTSYGNTKEILKFNNFTATSVIVSDDGVTTVKGKKIIPAGTIVGGKGKSVYEDANEPVIAKNDGDADGVLLTDVDVTYGSGSGTMVIFGFVDIGKLPEVPTAEAVKALNMIRFLD